MQLTSTDKVIIKILIFCVVHARNYPRFILFFIFCHTGTVSMHYTANLVHNWPKIIFVINMLANCLQQGVEFMRSHAWAQSGFSRHWGVAAQSPNHWAR